VIDGAQGQVQAASSALRELGLTVHVIGLAKRLEEVWVQDSSEPLILPRNSPALHLLQRVRDEAHRTAIAFHRKRRGKRAITSDLDDIPGLGDVRKKALLANFSSVADIRQATVEELVKAPGIGPSLAETIYAHLHKPKVLD
jgi:excinuclease ABC subunit C